MFLQHQTPRHYSSIDDKRRKTEWEKQPQTNEGRVKKSHMQVQMAAAHGGEGEWANALARRKKRCLGHAAAPASFGSRRRQALWPRTADATTSDDDERWIQLDRRSWP